MATETIKVPDIGGSEGVEVIEISVSVGDTIAVEDSVVVLETDKASMEIPATVGGKVKAIKVKEGDKVSEGDALIEVEAEGQGDAPAAEAVSKTDKKSEPEPEPAPAASGKAQEVDMKVPDIGGSEGVEVIEVCVAAGDEVAEGDSLIVLETDKASMEIPAEASGKVVSIKLKEGDKVSQGELIGVLAVAGGVPAKADAGSKPAAASKPAAEEKAAPVAKPAAAPQPQAAASVESTDGDVYAGPAVRKLGRQLGVDLSRVSGSGPRSRITKDDVRHYVKNIVTSQQSGGAVGSGIPQIPAVDFAKFGEVELVKMSKIKKLTADNMTRNWLNVPHVTQWDDVDITEMEDFRQGLKAEAEKRGSKLTPLPFILKACAAALRAEPSFNVSLHHDGEHIVQKNYVHIGVAVDTPVGLLVPVVRDVDKKGLWELTDEINALAKKARDGKLMPNDMQGGCFSVSSLGAIGGSGFTPLVNAPEVAILGVSRAQIKPHWNGKEFVPRNMLPISLSYDHRAVNGADAGRFFTYLASALADVRRLLL